MNAKSLKRLALMALIGLLFLAGCSRSMVETASLENADPTASSAIGVESTLYRAYAIPTRILAEAETAAEYCAQAVFAASHLNGGSLVTTGTYQVHSQGESSYTPSPEDRLIVLQADGTAIEQIIFGINGDFRAGVDHFLAGVHSVSCLVSRPGMPDLKVEDTELGVTATLKASGTIQLDGMAYDIYLTRQESWPDPSDAGHNREADIKGSILSGELSIQVDEKVSGRSAAGDTFTRRTINTRWTVGPDEYRFEDVTITPRITDELPDAGVGSRTGAGRLLRNGLLVGKMAIEEGSNQVKVWIDATGEVTRLAAWDTK